MRHYFSSYLKHTRVIFAFLLLGCVLPTFLVSCGHKVSKTNSLFITMKDGVKLAAAVHLPEDLAADDTVPALLYQTRYWRWYRSQAAGMGNSLLTAIDKLFLTNGYAVVKVDVRGTGASYGFRKFEYGHVEVLDDDIVEWIVQQPWSNGKVGSYGISYTGTTAEFLLANEHPAVKAAILGWSDFNGYKSPVKPYGIQSDHRNVSKNPYLNQETPYHSFSERDAMPLVPGEITELTFELQPTSVLIKKGHKIRVAIAGADKDNFNRIPTQGTPTITVARNRKYSSFLTLPASDRIDDSLE